MAIRFLLISSLGCTALMMITSQLPVTEWHKAIGDATLADAILDRLLHNSHQLKLKGESMRKSRGKVAESDQQD